MAAVVVLGVEYGIVLAIIASIIEHLRHSYRPLNCVLVKSPDGHWQPVPAEPGARTEEGLVAYRFGTSLYYANASRLLEDVAALVGHGGPLRWLVIDCAAIGDVDYTASAALVKVVEHAHHHHVHLVLSCVLGPVRQQLDRYGISKALGQDAYFDTPGEALEAFHSHRPLGEALMPVMSRPTMRACTVSMPSKVRMAQAGLGPIVYSIHHPFADASTPANSTTWWKEFGYLIDHPASTGVAPVVAGEWTNFTASAANPHPYCSLDAPTSVPNFLSYLQTLGVGLSAYQLSGPTAGYLLKVNQAWTDTTNYTDAAWNSGFCNYPDGTQTIPLLGAGSLIRAWFQSQD
jgi:anti-anti-sigma regulatory factor